MLASANVFCSRGSAATTDYAWFSIRRIRNGTAVEKAVAISNRSYSFDSCVMSPVLIDVEEGDVIQLFCKEPGSTIRSNNNTYMTVIALG